MLIFQSPEVLMQGWRLQACDPSPGWSRGRWGCEGEHSLGCWHRGQLRVPWQPSEGGDGGGQGRGCHPPSGTLFVSHLLFCTCSTVSCSISQGGYKHTSDQMF